ncbi:hypothetical protein RUM44_011869 [Polyplax serrata]|uniref:Galactokinase n=1 Tax=Polyplax serrata TaxID=468196 RepID=A0ABR1B9R2_POLSC
MTNLTSEQYRDVLRRVNNCMAVPTVQQLLRRAVETFYNRFGGYPEMAGVAPGKVGIFGEQTQFDGGLAMPTATPMATIMVGRRARGSRFTVVTSADVGKPHKVKFSFSVKRPLAPGCPTWLNYVKGVIEKYGEGVPPFEAALESSIPPGVGLGSSAAIETATYTFLEVLIGKKTDPLEKVTALQEVEKDYASKKVGVVDRITSILAKDRHTMLIDCKTNDVEWISFQNPKTALVVIDTHEKDTLTADEYTERSKYIDKACEILGVSTLRDCTEEDLTELENRVSWILHGDVDEDGENEPDGTRDEEVGNGEESETKNSRSTNKFVKLKDVWPQEEYDIMIKRARFFVTEMIRITEALEAWKEGDAETFGKKMEESHKSLKEDFEFDNPLSNFLVDTSLQVEGVLGSRMTGMGLGFGGGIVSLVRKENIEKYCNYVTERFMDHRGKILEDLKAQRENYNQKRFEIQKKAHSAHYNPAIASSEKIGKIQDYMAGGGSLNRIVQKRMSLVEQRRRSSLENKRMPCIVKVEKPPGGCGTWGRYEKNKQKEEFLRKASIEEEKSLMTTNTQVEVTPLALPSYYIVSPFPGARMMFVTKTDILRSLYATPVPHPKAIVRSAFSEFSAEFGTKPEAVGVAPGTLTLFGEFMEFHLGYIICMALPMVTVTVGGRNDSVYLNVKTMSKEVETPNVMKYPVPCVRNFQMESRSWVNFLLGCTNEFKGHVPGFNAVVGSSIPILVGLNSCSALQASFYTFLENLTKECTVDPLEKADRCAKSEYEFRETPSELVTRCSAIKFLPTFLCKDGNLMFINCKKYKITQYFFDHPSYVFLIGCCRNNTTTVTLTTLDERLKMCVYALEILGQKSLLKADLKHLRCLKKRDATDETIKRVKYVITEHQRTIEAVKAIKNEDYERVGLLMCQSHASLRDDYQVSSPEIEALVSLAMGVPGVLGAKMLGRGLNASIIVLLKLSEVDTCIRHIRKNYRPKDDKPNFYVVKPSGGAFMMNPAVEMSLVP